MRIPRMPVINPPVRKEMSFGKALAKSLAGETTFAAMLTESVATTTVNIEMAMTTGEAKGPTSWTGSHDSPPPPPGGLRIAGQGRIDARAGTTRRGVGGA